MYFSNYNQDITRTMSLSFLVPSSLGVEWYTRDIQNTLDIYRKTQISKQIKMNIKDMKYSDILFHMI